MASRAKDSASCSSSPSIQTLIEQSAQRIIMLLEQGRAKTGLPRSDFFARALRVWDAELGQVDIDEFLNVACVGVEAAMGEIALAFEELLTQAGSNYYDILGATFMLAGLAWKTVGDEYTPWDLVQLVTRLTLVDFKPPQPGDRPITVYDPCCGSGAFLLGVLDYVDAYYPEVLDRGQVEVYGQELTSIGWLMCRINLHIHQLARCFRRPWSCQIQEAFSSPVPVQQKSADITIDEELRRELLASHRPSHPIQSGQLDPQQRLFHGPDPRPPQGEEELFSPDSGA